MGISADFEIQNRCYNMSANQKVSANNFLHMQEKIETQKGENKILRQKLQSKSEALIILSQELDKVRNECEDYRELTHRLQTQWSLLSSDLGGPSHVSLFNNSKVSELREENKRLINEREHLRKVLTDREDDIKLIRKQWLKEKKSDNHEDQEKVANTEMVLRLESLQIKYDCLKRDLQSLLDEKVDLVEERDAYKSKVHRLNHSMTALLKSDGYKTLDVDSLLSENRFLRESLEHTKEEKELANEMGRRYKKALDRKSKNTSEVGLKETEEDDIKTLIRQTSFPCPSHLDLTSAQSLRELATSLLETLNERMLQLKHQRRANKHLMDRIAQVEAKIKDDHQDDPDAAQRALWPSQYLMKDYSPLSIVNDRLDLMLDQSDVYSPDIADLHKRFDAILNQEKTIADQEEDTKDDLDEDFKLPDHLQQLVNQALASS